MKSAGASSSTSPTKGPIEVRYLSGNLVCRIPGHLGMTVISEVKAYIWKRKGNAIKDQHLFREQGADELDDLDSLTDIWGTTLFFLHCTAKARKLAETDQVQALKTDENFNPRPAFKEGDRGRVCQAGSSRITVTWYRTGIVSAHMVEECPSLFVLVGKEDEDPWERRGLLGLGGVGSWLGLSGDFAKDGFGFGRLFSANLLNQCCRLLGEAPRLALTEEVEALWDDPMSEDDGATSYRQGDRGRVSRLDPALAITWYRSGFTSEHPHWEAPCLFQPVGEARSLVLGDEVEAVPVRFFRAERGHVTAIEVGEDGRELLKVTWLSSERTSTHDAATWPLKLRFITFAEGIPPPWS